jgi:glycosyltransferase involved in cell wall biosynthesis
MASRSREAPAELPLDRRPGSVTLLVVALDEIDGLRAIMPRVKSEWCDQILLVDGNSGDGSVEYAQARGYDVMVQRERGIRAAYFEGFPLVRGEYVITFSPDGNSVPELIPELIAKIREGYDMVIASRYLPPAKSEDDDWLTGFGNWMLTRLVNVLHGSHYTDAMVIYRIYRTELFWQLDLHRHEAYATEKIFRTGIGVEPLLSVRAAKRRLRIAEIPGDEPARLGGERKLQAFRWGGAYILQILRERFYWR